MAYKHILYKDITHGTYSHIPQWIPACDHLPQWIPVNKNPRHTNIKYPGIQHLFRPTADKRVLENKNGGQIIVAGTTPVVDHIHSHGPYLPMDTNPRHSNQYKWTTT